MFRVLKWTTPFVALALLLALGAHAHADEAKKETGTVSGTILDKDGHAAPGVQVRLFNPYERGQRPGHGQGAAKAEKQNADPAENSPAHGDKGKGGKGEKKGDRPQPIATTSTDKEGKFSMADVPVGKYVVQAMVRGVGSAREQVEVTAGSDAKVELKLKEREANKGGDRSEKKAEKKAAKQAAKKGTGATE